MRRNSEIILAEEYPFISKMLEPLHEMVIILDQERKIQYFNNSFQNFANQFGLNAALGILPGDAFNCIHALAGDELCGNTAFCKYCGGNHAIIKSMQGESGENECRIVSDNGNAFDLKVNTSPMEISGKEYTLYCITDASSENRRQNLEKIFFHDVNNLVNGMSLIMELIADNIKENRQPELYENVVLLDSSLASLKNEIQAQYLLALAEKDELTVSSQKTCLNTLLRDVARFFESSTSDNGIEIITEFAEDDLCVMTDPVLVKRVAINMVKNACEASVEGQKVKIGFSRTSDSVVIKVHNESSIPEEVSSSIFKRSFSTKGEGRGLGTYSMRLLTERYLQGKIYFTSNKKSGTTFYAELPVS